jgi:hypothetical protein
MAQRPSLDLRLRIPEGILCHDFQGEMVLLNLNTGVYFGLNQVGTRAWELIQTHQSLKKVVEILLDEYEVPPDQCTQDLLELVEHMKESRLLEVLD